MWFGTDGGLHLYNEQNDSFSVYNTKDGFVDNGIRSIIEDEANNLWLGTNNGVVMFNPDTKLVKIIGATMASRLVALLRGRYCDRSRRDGFWW